MTLAVGVSAAAAAAAAWLLIATTVATDVAVKPVSATSFSAAAATASALACGVVAARMPGSDAAAASEVRLCSIFCSIALSMAACVMTVPSMAVVPTAEAKAAFCSWVATTTMRAMVPAVALSALVLLVKSSNSETLMPSCAFTADAASAVLAPVLATVDCTRVVSGLTTAVWSAGPS